MCFFRKKKMNKDDVKEEKNKIDFILALYLNQRFVYDILAIKNDGFTEFYEIKDQKANSNSIENTIEGKFGTNNEFSLIATEASDTFNTKMGEDKNNEKTYKKTHTPTSLFMQVYNYLKKNNEIKELKNISQLDNLQSGDFVELKSSIELTTIVDFFEDMSKALEISDAFTEFAKEEKSKNKGLSELALLKRKIDNVIKILGNSKENIKYAVCNIEENSLVLKLNTEYFINSDYSEIKNGEFRIIGKILEIIPEGKEVLLDRENAIGIFDENLFDPIKQVAEGMPNFHFTKFKHKIEGKTCVIMPIVIGI